MIEEVYKNIFRIEVPLPGTPLKSLNAYCITGGERALLIDTGFNLPECRAALLHGLHELGVSRGKLDVCITHLHSDHAGLAGSVAEGRESRIFCSQGDGDAINAVIQDESVIPSFFTAMLPHGFDPEDLQVLCGPQSQQAEDSSPPETQPEGGRRKTGKSVFGMHKEYAPREPLPFAFVHDGDTLGYGGYALQVCSAPGHTPDGFALYEARHKLFFAGDHILGGITPNIIRWAKVKDSLGNYLRSLEESARLDIVLALPGHRALIRDATARIRQIQAHHARRLEEVRRILAENGEVSAYFTASRLTWDLRYASWQEFPIPQKWFATGEALAHLDHLAALGEAVEVKRGDKSLFRQSGSVPV